MSGEFRLQLQVGGTLNPRKHVYIERPEDSELLRLLLRGEFCNVLSPRQMGKSSLMARTMMALLQNGVRSVSIDLAGELGSTSTAGQWYRSIIERVSKDLGMELDVLSWWGERSTRTINQRLLDFFRDELCRWVDGPVVIFLDEIDSTLRLSYTDDLFTAIRTIYNERSNSSALEAVTFCLLGVATPNELVKDRRTTAYNVGQTIELRDFNEERDDLSLLESHLNVVADSAQKILRRVLYWTGGHPYLTIRFCRDLANDRIRDASEVDFYVKGKFSDLNRLSVDIHFQQIVRFFGARVSDDEATLDLYERIMHKERDEGTLVHATLRLSGLVKVNEDGFLVVRNRIYEHLFDHSWIRSIKPVRREKKERDTSRNLAMSLAAIMSLVIAGLSVYIVTLQKEFLNPQENPFVASLQSLGSARGADTRDPVVVPSDTNRFVVVFKVPYYTESYARRSVELRDENGDLIWSSESLKGSAGDEFSLMLSRQGMPAGDYEIQLYGHRKGGGSQVLARYSMPIVYR